MCDGDDFGPSVMTKTRPVARKEHRCCECGRTIPKGTQYVRTWGIWDGRPDSYAQHVECRELLEYISGTYCGGHAWTFGSLRDEISEYTDYGTSQSEPFFGEALRCRMAAIEARYPS